MTLPRVVSAETLDHLAPDDARALHARRDLVRVHRVMGTRATVCRAWQALVSPERARAPLRILELGAGDGSLLLGVAAALAPAWPQVQLSLLDRQRIVTPATLAAFAALGWSAEVEVADVLAWAEPRNDAARGAPAARWDLITTALFLHHFKRPELEWLLAAVAARTDRFFACEPRRSWLALAGSHLVGALGAHAVTREDAVLSVHAGFRATEIAEHWPHGGSGWQTKESAAGLFGHGFSARRTRADA